jgi:hypothetical protein
VKRACLVSILCLVLFVGMLTAVPRAQQASQNARPGGAPRAALVERDRARLQITIMEAAFQRSVETTHSHQLEEMMPAMFAFDANVRARGFRLDGYGVFFDVDLPPIPRSVEWTLKALDTGAVMVPDIRQLKVIVSKITDPAIRSQFDPVIQNLEAKATSGPPTMRADREGNITLTQRTATEKPSDDPFRAYVNDLTNSLLQVMIDYGATIELAPNDYLHVAAREMQPKLMPGNPTEATITLRIKGSDLAALKVQSITPDEARKRVEIKAVY